MTPPSRFETVQHSLLNRHTGLEEEREVDNMLKCRVVLV